MQFISNCLCYGNWIIGGFTAIVLYLFYWYKRPNKFPPGPRGLPLVGYLPFMSKNIEKDINQISQKFGPILRARMGPTDSMFLNDFDSIQKAFVKNGSVFSGRGQFAHFEKLKRGHGIVFADYGEVWKTQRKFGLMTLRGFGDGKEGMENICLEEVFYLNK